jgi:hypothetical protein
MQENARDATLGVLGHATLARGEYRRAALSKERLVSEWSDMN